MAADEVALVRAAAGNRGSKRCPGGRLRSPQTTLRLMSASWQTREGLWGVAAADPGVRLAGQNVASTPASGIASARNPSAFSGTIAFTNPIKVSRQRFTRPPIERS